MSDTAEAQALRAQFIQRFGENPTFHVKHASELDPNDYGRRIVWAALNAPDWPQWKGAGSVELARIGAALKLTKIKAIPPSEHQPEGTAIIFGVAPQGQGPLGANSEGHPWYIPGHWLVGVADD